MALTFATVSKAFWAPPSSSTVVHILLSTVVHIMTLRMFPRLSGLPRNHCQQKQAQILNTQILNSL